MEMNWDWACQQLLKRCKVRHSDWKNGYSYIFMDCSGKIMINDFYEGVKPYTITSYDLTSNWNLWKFVNRKKNWSEKQVAVANVLLLFGFNYLACDYDGRIFAYPSKPVKDLEDYAWHEEPFERIAERFIVGVDFKDIFGGQIFWEEKEPIEMSSIAKAKTSKGGDV